MKHLEERNRIKVHVGNNKKEKINFLFIIIAHRENMGKFLTRKYDDYISENKVHEEGTKL